MRFFVIFVFIASALFAQNSYQLPLKKGVWHLVGINGFHHQMPLPQNFESGGAWVQIRENSAPNPTYDYLDATTKNSHISPNTGSKIHSTLGLEVLSGTDTALDEVVINYQLLDKNSSKPMRTMFVSSKGAGREADLKIFFQSDYEGKIFYIKLDDSLVMEGVFAIDRTLENPLTLKPRKDTYTTAKKIVDIFDANLTDNVIEKLELFDIECSSLNCVSEGEVVGGRQINSDINITAYGWNAAGGNWAIFTSNGINNDFDSFVAGKAYWVRIDGAETGDDAGFILGQNDIKSGSYTTSTGWNLLSFNDSFLRKTPTAIFVPASIYDAQDIVVRDNFSKDVIIVATDGNSMTSQAVARDFNQQIYALNQTAKNGFKIRAYPTTQNANIGVLIISDEDFEIGMQNIKSIAGRDLIEGYQESVNGNMITFYSSRIDEYMLAFNPNEVLISTADQVSRFQMTTPQGAGVRSVDFSLASSIAGVNTIMQTALSAVDNGVYQMAYAVDSGFDGGYKTVLIATSKRFYLRDATHQKLYKYDDSLSGEKFLLEGAASVEVDYGASIDDTILNINSVKNLTAVVAHKLGADQILLTSVEKRSFFIKEKGKRSQFVELNLKEANSKMANGAISELTTPALLASSIVKSDGSLYNPASLNDNLTYQAHWADDFPSTGALYDLTTASSKPEVIVGGVTREDKTILWRQSDLTVPVTSWKSSDSRFNLFKLHKDRGYWVYMRSGTTNSVGISGITLTPQIARHYSNNFVSTPSGAVAETQNSIDLAIDVEAYGLDGLGSTAGEMAENVDLIYEGKRFSLIKSGGALKYFGEIGSGEIKEASSQMPKSSFVISVASGKGARFVQSVEYDNLRSDTPTYELDKNKESGTRGAVIVDPKQANRVIIYDGNISDIGGNKLIFNGLVAGKTTINLLAESSVVFGTPSHPYYDLRIIGESANKLHSDTRRLFYAPIYKGTEIISSNAQQDTNDTNSTPIRFSYDGQTYASVLDNNGYETDSGVQLKILDKNATDSNTTLISYQSVAGASFTACGTPDTNDLILQGETVAQVGFCPTYNGKVFYLYHKEKELLSYGIFGSDQLYTIDTNQSIVDPRR